MAAPSHWGTTPRQSIEAECARRGADAVVAGCIALLERREVDAGLVLALGGPPASRVLDEGPDHWLRVWAARGLLWAWQDDAVPSLRRALADEAWRVREAAARVAGRHRVDEVLPQLQALQNDDVARVRSAARRALARLTS